MPTLSCRRATFQDRDRLTAMLDVAFHKQTQSEPWFGTHLPHLFTEQRMVEHTLMIEDGDLLGCVGCYTFQASLRGQPVMVAGIGQVATAPAARNRGMMTQMMNMALASSETPADLYFLYGDRTRYGHFGFALGGHTFHATTWDRYAPVQDSGPEIRALDLRADAKLIDTALAAQPFAMQQDSVERLGMLTGKSVRGWTDNNALILTSGDGRQIHLTYGSTAAIIRLVSHHVALQAVAQPNDTNVTLICDPGDQQALGAAKKLGGSFHSRPTAMLRVGRLAPLLTAWVSGIHLPPGTHFAPCIVEGGYAGRVRISVAQGRIAVAETRETPDLTLTGVALAELIFGTVPHLTRTHGLADNSVLHHVLPLSFHISECYAL